MFGWLRNFALYIIVMGALNRAAHRVLKTDYMKEYVKDEMVLERFDQAQGIAAILVLLLRDQTH
tara:strand:- start:451 stop:642 length:192 start_codon:yes stop_codon:yes gene_type:complete